MSSKLLEEREKRRRASIIGRIMGEKYEPIVEEKLERGRPKSEREVKKRVSLAVFPSLYEDIQKIAFVQRRSVSDILDEVMSQYRDEHYDDIDEYDRIQGPY